MPALTEPLFSPARQGLPSGGHAAAPFGRKAHLIGIGGAGMRSLAQVLLEWGWRLSGSDLAGVPAELAGAGVGAQVGHALQHVPPDATLVIHSDAIPPENPERRRALELGIPDLSYFQTLGRIMADRFGLAVAGTHGKSTTTAMAAEILIAAGLDPTVVFGAAPLGRSSGGRAGQGERMLVEACEYRRNFLHLPVRHAVILGIEADHFDCYRSLEEVEEAFARFARAVPSEGLVLARADCAPTRRATGGLACRVETFGLSPGADWSASELQQRRGRYGFCIVQHGRPLARVRLRVPGRHNVLNALAAAALAWHQGVGAGQIAQALGRFRGIRRRLEMVGRWRAVPVIDDYAHHPTEVSASLLTVRQMCPGRRVCCVFQPHQASRTERLLDELATSLQNADKVIVAEIYRAREPGCSCKATTAADLAERATSLGGDALNLGGDDYIVPLLRGTLRPGDVLITMGAGDIRKVCDELVQRVRENRAAG